MLSTTNWHLPSASTETSLMAQWSGILLWCKSHRFHPWVRKIPWRRERQPTCIFSPGKPQEQRSLAGYSPWGRESQTRLGDSTHLRLGGLNHMLLQLLPFTAPERRSCQRSETRQSVLWEKLAEQVFRYYIFSGADFMSPILVSPHI